MTENRTVEDGTEMEGLAARQQIHALALHHALKHLTPAQAHQCAVDLRESVGQFVECLGGRLPPLRDEALAFELVGMLRTLEQVGR